MASPPPKSPQPTSPPPKATPPTSPPPSSQVPTSHVKGEDEEMVPPRRREAGADAPDYNLWPDKFSVQLHHGGFFCGIGSNSWEQVYWLQPGKSLADDLKRQILYTDALEVAVVARVCKILLFFVDHANFLQKQSIPDDVAVKRSPLPKVLTPIDPLKARNQRNMGTEGDARAGQHGGSDTDLFDSDYDLEDEDDSDDDEFVKAVDDDVEDVLTKKEAEEEVWEDAPEEDDELQLPECEDEYKIKFHTKSYNPETDMENPQFKLSMVFSSMVEVRKTLAQYTVKQRVQIIKKRNNAKRLEAECEGECPNGKCPWKLVVSKDNRTDKFLVKEFVVVHDCERVWDVKELTYGYLANKFVEEFRDNENVSLKSFAKTVQKELNMTPNRYKLARAKYKALSIIHGDEKQQYNLLWDYGEEIRYTNPGSTFYLRTIGNPGVFSTLYMALDGCKRGYLKGCRPIICLDGTHIKTKYGGQLLTAVSIDGNDCIYPVAMAVVEVECYSSWKWFLTTLKNDLNICNTSPFTIMSDKQN